MSEFDAGGNELINIAKSENPTAAALQGDLDVISPRNTVVLLGDSLTAQNGGGFEDPFEDSTWSRVGARGYFNWARCFVNSPISLVSNEGVGGETSAEIFARVGDAIATGADICIVLMGRNDMTSVDPYTSIIPNLQATVEALISAGITPIVLTVTDVDDQANTTVARLSAQGRVNDWILSIPKEYPQVQVADVCSALTDQSTGVMAEGIAYDGTHWSDVGACRAGLVVADCLNKILPVSGSQFHPEESEINAITNPSFSNNGAGWSQAFPGGAYNFNPTGLFGKNEILFTGLTSSLVRVDHTEDIADGKFSIGDVVKARMEIEWDFTDCAATDSYWFPLLSFRCRDAGATQLGRNAYAFYMPIAERATPVNFVPQGSLTCETTGLVVPENTEDMYYSIGFYGCAPGGGSFTIKNFTAFKVV